MAVAQISFQVLPAQSQLVLVLLGSKAPDLGILILELCVALAIHVLLSFALNQLAFEKS